MRRKFLLDANISPETAIYLRSLGLEVKSLIEEGLSHLEDAEVVKIALREKRMVITLDLDFGEMYYFAAEKKFSVIVLRLADQRVEAVNAALQDFFNKQPNILRGREINLVILRETEARIVRP